MIRFYDNQIKKTEDVVMATEHITFGRDIWNDGKEYFRQNVSFDPAIIHLLPVENEKHETICYAYQDREANRELRMLRELIGNEEAIPFRDLFPEIQNVIVCGCNELAYYFVLYLEKQQVNVSVLGKYWNLFGYENNRIADFEAKGNMIIYAEEIRFRADSLYQTVIRSASPSFECIDRIYEANVVEGRINDTIGNFADVLEKIRGRNIVILGTDTLAQDTYDLLYGNGIDICCFAEFVLPEKGKWGTLLGKKVIGVEEIIKSGGDRVFIDSSSQNSAFGTGKVDVYDFYGYLQTGNVDVFDYYGYKRNEDFFLIRDYADIPCSCLIHVLNGKRIFLAGDEHLCSILSDFMMEVERGNVDTKFTDISQINMEETDILCIVYPWDGASRDMRENPKLCTFLKELSEKKNVSYTNYFSNMEAFVTIDLFRNKNNSKYSIKQLMPKGILLGRITPGSGNYFFRGLMDGHPNILQLGHSRFNANLFLYCIRLAAEKSENILYVFKKLYREESEAEVRDEVFLSKAFEESLKDLLSLKEYFTSQELFILFHIAYVEALSGEKAANLQDKIIYWEPHGCPRNKFPFLSKWLDDGQINGRTLFMHRDNTIWMGSFCKNSKEHPEALFVIECMSRENSIETDCTSYMNWEEFQVRFEDIKLHPKEELMKICDICGIPWSITMLSTTYRGKSWDFQGVYDFDLRPVFNRYEKYLSELDHFKISLISSPYQKKYGYSYENCMRFSRSELQEIFLKDFRFQQKFQFSNERDRRAYFLRSYALLRKHLWIMRKHAVMDDIVPEFGNVQLEDRKVEDVKLDRATAVKEIENLVNFVKQQKRLILYGTGRDCEGLLKRLDETVQSEIWFCDQKAEYMEMVFHGKKVLAPEDLCENFKDYTILVTSSLYYKVIQCQLENLGISSNRIVCNKVQIWEDGE